jgi:GWxTD domain-containing protein
MDMGLYRLSVELKKGNGETAAKTDKLFFSRWAGLPSSIKDLDKAVDEMTYIATPKEMAYVKDAPDDKEKSKRFVEFWQKKDPSPSTDENEVFEEYYRRVTYSNEHFKHYQEGWRTDMGMVYITLGIPSNIERHPFEFDSKPYEIWDYYDINKRFIFFDETGFGDYRLTQQPYGNWWKYRQ